MQKRQKQHKTKQNKIEERIKLKTGNKIIKLNKAKPKENKLKHEKQFTQKQYTNGHKYDNTKQNKRK